MKKIGRDRELLNGTRMVNVLKKPQTIHALLFVFWMDVMKIWNVRFQFHVVIIIYLK